MIIPTVYDCNLIKLNRIYFRVGSITPIQNLQEIPFEIKRVFYLYDIPAGTSRGAHAHYNCHQFLMAASGSFEVGLDDGNVQRTVSLNRPFLGLHVPPGLWAQQVNFSSGAVCFVLASQLFDEKDYIRDYERYLAYRKQFSLPYA
jgi:hypothetical protein